MRVVSNLAVSGMWSTRQMVSRGDDRELFQRSTVRELVVYCCFLLVLIAITQLIRTQMSSSRKSNPMSIIVISAQNGMKCEIKR